MDRHRAWLATCRAIEAQHPDEVEARRRETERRIMGGGYIPNRPEWKPSRPLDSDDLIETADLQYPPHDP